MTHPCDPTTWGDFMVCRGLRRARHAHNKPCATNTSRPAHRMCDACGLRPASHWLNGGVHGSSVSASSYLALASPKRCALKSALPSALSAQPRAKAATRSSLPGWSTPSSVASRASASVRAVSAAGLAKRCAQINSTTSVQARHTQRLSSPSALPLFTHARKSGSAPARASSSRTLGSAAMPPMIGMTWDQECEESCSGIGKQR